MTGKVHSVPVIEVPMSQIRDWDTFHDTFAQTLGFPDFYGRNIDAWIDCLTYADEADKVTMARSVLRAAAPRLAS